MPKECFKVIVDAIRKAQPKINLLDVGCDQGQFLSYLHEEIPHITLSGLDIRPTNLKHIPAVFYEADISKKETLRNKPFDIITMIGVHSEFGDIRHWLWNLLGLGHKKSTWFVMGYFNPHPIDIRVQIQTKPGFFNNWNARGFNIISYRTVINELKFMGYEGIFSDFDLSVDIPKTEDPLRVWTFKDEDGKRIQTNGVCQIVPFKLLTIKENRLN